MNLEERYPRRPDRLYPHFRAKVDTLYAEHAPRHALRMGSPGQARGVGWRHAELRRDAYAAGLAEAASIEALSYAPLLEAKAERILARLPRVALTRFGAPHKDRPDAGDLINRPPPPESKRPEDPALSIFSLGTYGVSKGIVLGHRSVIANVNASVRALFIDVRDGFIAIVAPHHTFAATCTFLVPLVAGGLIVFPEKLIPTVNLRRVREARLSELIGLPRLLDSTKLGMRSELAKRPPQASAVVGGMIKLPEYKYTRSAGLRAKHAELRIGDAGLDGGGEVQVRSPSILLGYWEKPDATAEALTAVGRLRTGKLGNVDPRYILFITGRSNKLIVSEGGKNLIRKKIERRFEGAPWEREVLALGRREAGRMAGEEIVAVCVPDWERIAAELPDADHKAAADGFVRDETRKVNRYPPPRMKVEGFICRKAEFKHYNSPKITRSLYINYTKREATR